MSLDPRWKELYKSIEEDKMGVLKCMKFSDLEFDLFTEYLDRKYKTDAFSILFSIFEYEDLMLLMDLMSGTSIKIPKRAETMKTFCYIKMYARVKELEFTDEAYIEVAKRFNKKTSAVRKIVDKVEKTLIGGRDEGEEDE